MLLIKNGRVADPATQTDARLDVLIEGERIAAVGPGLRAGASAEVVDASAWIVAPGFLDLHCHLREPGDESSETIESGTRAAAAGGFTAVCPMPNTHPVNDNAAVTRFILDRAAACPVRVWPVGAVSIASRGEALAEIGAMKEAGIVAVSDDGHPVSTAKLLRQAMEYCLSLGLPLIDHCEDRSLSAGAVMREGPRSVRLGLAGMPASTESIAVARDVQIAELVGGRLHIAHLSTAESLAIVRHAKSRGLGVTCEITPHHFTLTDDDVGYDSRFKVNPPLASKLDREALLEGLADGTADAISTDHAPHEPARKDVEFDRAAFGMIGFETALSLALEQLYHSGRVGLTRLVELFTTGPARVLGLTRRLAPGEPADLTLFSLDHAWTFEAARSASRSHNSPFDGRSFRGAPMMTVVAGRIAFRR